MTTPIGKTVGTDFKYPDGTINYFAIATKMNEIAQAVDGLNKDVNNGFTALENRINGINQRLNTVERQILTINRRGSNH